MKKTGIVIIIALLIVSLFSITAYAEGKFGIAESYPEDGQTNTSVENLGVKLTFTTPVGAKENQEANRKCFELVDSEGKVLESSVYFNPKEPTQVLVLYGTNQKQGPVKGNSEYSLRISGNFMDDAGDTLGKDSTIKFKTLNQSFHTKVYFVMMALMMVGMIFFTSKQAKKQFADQKTGTDTNDTFNPYKEAKRTGKPLAEVIAQHEKEVAKREAKAAKEAAKNAEDDFDEEEIEEDNGNYKVKGPKPIAPAGGKTISGRKALAEARAAEEERLAKRRAAAKRKK